MRLTTPKPSFFEFGISFIILFLLNLSSTFSQDKTVNVGIVTDCNSERSLRYAQSILAETRTLLGEKYDVIASNENILQGDCSVQNAQSNLERLLADETIDLILGVDAVTSHIIAKGGPYEKPVLATTIVDAQAQKIPFTRKGRSGVKNLVYLELPFSPSRDLEIFQRRVGFEKVAVLLDEAVFEGIPELKTFLESNLNDLGVSYKILFTQESANATLAQLEDEDAIYIIPTNKFSETESQALIDGINERALRSFSLFGRLDVEKGVLAGVAPASNLVMFSRRMALNIQRIINGEDAEDLSVTIDLKQELVLNMETARKIDFSPSWDLLSEAVLINEEIQDIDRNITLFSAIEEALAENLDLAIVKQDVAVVEKDVDVANSYLLPELSANVSQTIIDEDLATVSNGQSPQYRGSGNLQLSQVIYSEQLTANRKIQQYLLEAQKASLDIQSLETILQTSTSYLQLMQAKTLEKIQRENLTVTRKNLEIARVGTSLGQTGPSDLYRWQGEIANAKSDLLNATAQRRQAELAVNQVLNRPIGELFTTTEIDIQDSRYSINNEDLDNYINNPRDFERYVEFMVDQALKNAPSIVQLDANVKATERSLVLNQRNRYVPNVSLGAAYNHELYRGGAGKEFAIFFPDQPIPNDWNWNLSINASLPIFQGNRRTALVEQSKIQLKQIGVQRKNLERIVEQQVRAQMENIKASYTNIGLAKEAEEAVVRNFELVQEAYSQGAGLITQLLDAQNAAVSAQLNSANAVYIFLIDLLSLERATGSFYMLLTEEQRADYNAQVIDYFSRQ